MVEIYWDIDPVAGLLWFYDVFVQGQDVEEDEPFISGFSFSATEAMTKCLNEMREKGVR